MRLVEKKGNKHWIVANSPCSTLKSQKYPQGGLGGLTNQGGVGGTVGLSVLAGENHKWQKRKMRWTLIIWANATPSSLKEKTTLVPGSDH